MSNEKTHHPPGAFIVPFGRVPTMGAAKHRF